METSLLARLLGAARAVAPLAPVNPAALMLPQLGLGQTVRAQVTARLADGSFRVVVDDAPLKLALPSGTKPGDALTLRLVAREPRLEFEIHRSGEPAEPRLSGAGRLIGQILREPVFSESLPARPVISAPVADAAKLREPLARAIQRSGLFYEAHQARWIDGDYPLALLQEEPQAAVARARLTTEHMPWTASAQSAAQGTAIAQLALLPQGAAADEPDAPDQPEPGEQTANDHAEVRYRNNGDSGGRLQEKNSLHTAAMHAGAGLSREARTDETAAHESSHGTTGLSLTDDAVQAKIARELLPMVRQQLEAIETRQIIWQGELWPGQPIRWQITDREPDPRDPEASREWLTRLQLQMPALGEIDAALAVSARGVRVVVAARDSATAEALRAAAPDLAQALEAAGLRVGTFEVRQHA